MKYLVLFAVLFIAYMVWRNNRITDDRQRGGAAPGKPQEMVACVTCGLHLPRSEAIFGSTGLPFCCQEHRLRGGP